MNNLQNKKIDTSMDLVVSYKINFKKLLILILLMLVPETLLSQPYYKKSEYSFGISSSFNLINDNILFSQLPNVSNCCQEFSSGSGFGLNLALYLQKNLFLNNFLNLKIGYLSLYSHLSSNQTEFINYNNQLYSAMIEHKINTAFNLIYLEPTYKIIPVDNLGIFFGGRVGYIINTKYDQAEYLIKPENTGTFENGRRVRNEHSGSIPDTKSYLLFVTFGLEYEISLDEFSFYNLAPFFSFNYGLNSLFDDRKFITNYISLGFHFYINPFIEISTPLKPEKENY